MAYTNLMYHIVFATKERRPLISTDILPRLCEYIGGIIRNVNGEILAANGTQDHIHIAASLPSTSAVADVLRLLKTNSSRWLHESFPGTKDFAWQESYSAFTVSKSSMPKVMQYIHGQQAHHQKMTFQEELIGLLVRHGIEYDERYIWK